MPCRYAPPYPAPTWSSRAFHRARERPNLNIGFVTESVTLGVGLIDAHRPKKAGNSEDTLVNREKEAHDRAETLFKKNEERRVKVATEYEAEADAARERLLG